jgi:hypothetical protein
MSLRTFALVASIVAGGGLYLFTRPGDPVSADAKQRMAAITEGLDREIVANLLCIEGGPFPYDTRRGGIECLRCEDLAAAGLLERQEGPDSSEERPYWIYDLTERGMELYTTDEDPVSGERSPRFCLGGARVHHLAAAQGGLLLSGTLHIGVEYVAEAVDPDPLLFEPEGEALGLPVPHGEDPKLFDPVVTTVKFAPGDLYIESDASFRYGSWINR